MVSRNRSLEQSGSPGQTYEVEVQQADGRRYCARILGDRIAATGERTEDTWAFYTRDRRILVVGPDGHLHELESPYELAEWFSGAYLAEALTRVGEDPIIEIGDDRW